MLKTLERRSWSCLCRRLHLKFPERLPPSPASAGSGAAFTAWMSVHHPDELDEAEYREAVHVLAAAGGRLPHGLVPALGREGACVRGDNDAVG